MMDTAEINQTVGYFLFDCLYREGVNEIFGVPGDYNFAILDILEKYKPISFVNCRNELNAGYAADAYARVKGMGAIITTFGVGEMSACNAIAGSYCENVPVIHIVGSPKTSDQREHKMMHHSLLDGDFDVFRKVYGNITSYTADITAENAALEIPAAIMKAKETKKPVYLTIATDVAPKPIMQRDVYIEQKQSSSQSLQAAVRHVVELINLAQKPVIISGVNVSRYNLMAQVMQLVEKMDVPVTTMMMGKGSFDESHRNFAGLYAGELGRPEVRNIVETSDCVLAVGTMWSDYNNGSYTAKINPLNIIEILPDRVKAGNALYENVLMQDALREIIAGVNSKKAPLGTVFFPYDVGNASLDDVVTSDYYYPRFQKMLKENDIIIADAGTFQFGIAELRLPKGATYINQGGWGSIGYGIPGAFGACMAHKSRRVILFVGDGSAQMTVQELSSILYNNCRPIIFLVNNKEYTIEKYLNVAQKQTQYNDIPMWDYSMLLGAFGGNSFTAKVHTNRELDEAIKKAEAECSEKLCLIEIYAPQMDAPQMVHKMTGLLEQMETQK